jgi:hypothetical protein
MEVDYWAAREEGASDSRLGQLLQSPLQLGEDCGRGPAFCVTVVVKVSCEGRKGREVGTTALVDEGDVTQGAMDLHDVHHANLLCGGLGEEGAHTLAELDTFGLGNCHRALHEIPFQADVDENIAKV